MKNKSFLLFVLLVTTISGFILGCSKVEKSRVENKSSTVEVQVK